MNLDHPAAFPDDLHRLELLLLDVDGVLTDGGILYGDQRIEIKAFHVADGLGIRLLLNAGIHVGIVTGRSSEAVLRRCEDLGIRILYDGVPDKGALLDEIVLRTGVSPDKIGFVGDDLPDIPLFKKIGFPFAVADAHAIVREAAIWTTDAEGGRGAVREICEMILKAKGFWDDVLRNYRNE